MVSMPARRHLLIIQKMLHQANMENRWSRKLIPHGKEMIGNQQLMILSRILEKSQIPSTERLAKLSKQKNNQPKEVGFRQTIASWTVRGGSPIKSFTGTQIAQSIGTGIIRKWNSIEIRILLHQQSCPEKRRITNITDLIRFIDYFFEIRAKISYFMKQWVLSFWRVSFERAADTPDL